MITLSANSSRGRHFLNLHRAATFTHLRECYTSYSQAKACAYAVCLEWFEKENGTRFRIISHNSMSFTCAWMTEQGLRVETAYNSYLVR